MIHVCQKYVFIYTYIYIEYNMKGERHPPAENTMVHRKCIFNGQILMILPDLTWAHSTMVSRWKIFPSSKWKQRCISLEIRACKNKWNEMNWKIKGSSGKVLVSLVFCSYVKFSTNFSNFCCFGSLKCHLPWLCYRLANGSATIESAHFPNLLMLSFPRGTVFYVSFSLSWGNLI